ncbi:MAG: aminoacyl-tRNA hydrolase [Methylococcaceae bacterium]|nr:aminoacyl-tRNA hydrolase [Methylococcaceae bacterium]
MIKLIVGLGNPDQQYEKNRHNVGFLFLERLVLDYGGSWAKESRFQGWLASCHIGSNKVLLLKPNTFMNLSGQAVGKIARYYKLEPEEILVVHDELDFFTGVVKLKKGGGHAGHNGLRDIIAHLSSKDFFRLRVGIDRPKAGKPVADYVLSNPSKTDMVLIEDGFARAETVLSRMVAGDSATAMNELHSD